MDAVYENSEHMDSTPTSRGRCSQYKGPAEVRTKVLLIVLCVSVVLLVGGLCVLGVLNFIRSYSCEPCEYGWTVHDGHCYLFSSEKRTWFASRLLCLASDAHLVIINNAKEQHFLVSKAKEFFWIGLNDLETEGRWVWVNNQTLNETGVQFWHKRESGQSEPDNWNKEDPSGENCASIAFWDIFHTWFDVPCNRNYLFICEKNQ